MTPKPKPTAKSEKYGITNPEVLTDGIATEESFDQTPEFGAPPEAAEIENSDALVHDDMSTVLARDTYDGKGDDEVPQADFVSFATEGVEDDGSALEFRETVEAVLAGEFGDFQERRVALKDAGHDVHAVMLEVNRRLASGSPSAYARADVKTAASQVIWGEWGNDTDEIRRNLAAVGYVVPEVEAEALKQLGG